MDDIVVKSKQADKVITDLEHTFTKLRANGIKLNLEKYVFGVPGGMLLGFIVFEHGIKANLEKISAIMRMGPIQNIKGYNELQGASPCSAILSHASVNEVSSYIGF